MRRSRPRYSGRRSEAARQRCGEVAARPVAPAVSAQCSQHRRPDPADRMQHHRRHIGREPRCAKCRSSTTGCRHGCSIPTAWRTPIPTAPSRGPSASMASTLKPRRPISTRTLPADRRRPDRKQATLDPGAALRPAAGDADHAPHLRRRMECRRQMDGHAAARVPAPHRRRHCAPNMCTSPARRATRAPSTWPPRCTRRRR